MTGPRSPAQAHVLSDGASIRRAAQLPGCKVAWRELYDFGFSLIPVRVGEKIPAIQWARFQTERATIDQISGWHRDGHNAGIVTGAISGILVVDCDTVEAVNQVNALGTRDTVSATTARGCHFYFEHPGFIVPNKISLLPGMDIRGDGGFVVAPGSVHPSGSVYRWLNHPAWNEIAPLPEWLFAKLCNRPKRPVFGKGAIVTAATAHGQKAAEQELLILRNAAEGGRNDQLNRSTFVLAQLAAEGQIDAYEAQMALRDAAHAIGLGVDETDRTLESAWRAGLAEPRGLKKTQAAQGLSVINARALLEMDYPDLQWAIPGVLPEGLAILAGRPKFGKSFLALQMANAVATGEGRSLGVAELQAGDVLVCALEDSERRLRDRLRLMYPFGNAPERLYFATASPRMDQVGIAELERWCDDHPKARLIILDTWRAIKPQSNGRASAYDEDANAAAPLLEFAKSRPGLAIVVVHHVRKAESEDIFDTISGTHGLTGIFDTLMVLGRHGEGAKLAAQGRDLDGYEKALERDRRTGGWTLKGDTIPLAKTGERQDLLSALAAAQKPLALADLAKAVLKKPDTTRHLLKGLIDEGLVTQPRHGKYSLQSAQYAQFGKERHLERLDQIEEAQNGDFSQF